MSVLRQNQSLGGRLFDGLFRPFDAAIEAAKTRAAWQRAYRQTYAELSMLSARDLADIGIDAGAIQQTAKEAADMAVMSR